MHLQILPKQIECEARRNANGYAYLQRLWRARHAQREEAVGVTLVATWLIEEVELPALDAPEWRAETWRQEFAGTCHSATETIYYRMPENITPHGLFNDLTAAWRADTPAWVHDVVQKVAKGQNFKTIGRVMLVKLAPHSRVAPHIDQGLYATTFDRYHVVIRAENLTSELVVNHVSYFVRQGGVVKLNHRTEHEAINHSDMPRVHLIIDGVLHGRRFE